MGKFSVLSWVVSREGSTFPDCEDHAASGRGPQIWTGSGWIQGVQEIEGKQYSSLGETAGFSPWKNMDLGGTQAERFYQSHLVLRWSLLHLRCKIWLDHWFWITFLFSFFFFFFLLFMATPMAYGGSPARSRIGTTNTSLHHSHSKAGSEPHLWPKPQLMATLDHWPRPGIEPITSWILIQFFSTAPQLELLNSFSDCFLISIFE